MFACPNCRERLSRTRIPAGMVWVCAGCGGRAATIPVLRQSLAREYVTQAWSYARDDKGVRRRACPCCTADMIDVPVVHGETSHWLDVCTRCHVVWFDAGEYEEAPAAVVGVSAESAGTDAELSPEARRRLAIEKVRRQAEEARHGIDSEAGIRDWWEAIPALLGLPIEEDHSAERRPWATWTLTAVIALVSIVAFRAMDAASETWGMVAADPWRHGGLTFITSFFLHAGWLHLLGNLYFLMIFGDNVEEYLGWKRYALLLLLSTVAGDLLYIAADGSSGIPSIGASGGVSGIIAFYALRFPHARLGIYWQFWFFFRRYSMPAWTAFLLWLLLQGLYVVMQICGASGVNALAHLGGAAVGVAFWWVGRSGLGEKGAVKTPA